MSLVAGTRLGPYEIVSPLGVGGMGEVYRARDTRLDRTVAVKVLPPHLSDNPEARQRFEREARAISSLNHPNICTLHDIGRQDGTDFLVMEHLEGETLADRLRRGPLPLELVLRYGIELCEGLERAHKSGVVHRDLKPRNIMLTKTGLKLMDFGLAKAVTPALVSAAAARDPVPLSTPTISLDSISAPAPAPTQAGTIVGTFHYLAPEVLKGSTADARSDIFSIGCVLYEMVTARPAFTGQSQISILGAVLEHEPEPIIKLQPSSPLALQSVVNACLAKDPEHRIQSAHDLKLQLQLVGEIVGSTAKPAVSGRTARQLALLAASLVVILGAATLWLLRTQLKAVPEAPPVELSVTLPPEISVSPLSAPIISPDGRAVIFVGRTPDRPDSMYLRRLDSPVVRGLEGTEKATHPFWSPDSSSVGFFAGAQLKRVDLASGRVQVLAGASDGRGGAWSRDGVIIFSPRAGSPLFRVNAAGGDPQPLTELKGQESHRWPSFLADSRRFVYTAESGAAPGGIFLASLDDPHGRLLTSDVINGQVAKGYLLFVRGTSVVSTKLDTKTGTLAGESTVVAEHVRVLPDRNLAEFSVAETGVLAYAPGDANALQLAWFDRKGRLLESINPRYSRGELDLSRDGRRLLTDYTNPDGSQSVEIIDLQRGAATPVAGSSKAESPIWSPSGESVVLGEKNIVRKWIDGSEREEVLVRSSVSLYPDHWSKDGRWLLYEAVDKQTNFDLMRLDMHAKGEPQAYLKTPANEAHGRISPDGRWVAYVSDESGQAEIYVQSFPLTGGGKWQISTQGGDQPYWRGDGGELYYLAPDLELMAVPIRLGKSFEPGAAVKLFQTHSVSWGITGNRNSYVASPDGKRFLVQYLPEQVGSQSIGIVQNWEQKLRRTVTRPGR